MRRILPGSRQQHHVHTICRVRARKLDITLCGSGPEAPGWMEGPHEAEEHRLDYEIHRGRLQVREYPLIDAAYGILSIPYTTTSRPEFNHHGLLSYCRKPQTTSTRTAIRLTRGGNHHKSADDLP
jgi:hypothetical protein